MSQLAHKLTEHVRSIAVEHDVEIVYRGRGRACRSERWVTIPEVRGRSTYYTALHELGHVLGPNPRRRLDQEMAAWRWAIDHAIVQPTPGVVRTIVGCLKSYRARAERAAFGTVLPEGFDAFIEEVAALG